MDPRQLVAAALGGDDLTARQVVKDAKRGGFSWAQAPATDFQDATSQAVYASLVELFAERAGEPSPAWTREVGPAPDTVFLMGRTSPAFRKACEARSPAPLRRRNVMALPDYLDLL